MQVTVRVQPEDFAIGEEYERLRHRMGGRVGAVASFVGLVRDQHEDQAVTGLTLEHYPGMTEASIHGIVAQAAARWALDDVVVIHRVGDLEAAAQIVFVQVAASHRDAAFAACEMIMDYLKTEAVFWKREAGAGAARWVESTGGDRERARTWKDPQHRNDPTGPA